jgi:hypothetical protein
MHRMCVGPVRDGHGHRLHQLPRRVLHEHRRSRSDILYRVRGWYVRDGHSHGVHFMRFGPVRHGRRAHLHGLRGRKVSSVRKAVVLRFVPRGVLLPHRGALGLHDL